MSAALRNTTEIDFSGDFSHTATGFDYSDNELYNLSSPLFAVLITIERLQKPDSLAVFKSLLKQQIIDLSEQGKKSKYPSAVIDKLCCLHSIVLDEFIIHSSWGEGVGWEHNTLLSELFNLQNGGDLFYTITDKALRQSDKMQDLLGVAYVFLQIGFKGRFRSRQSEKLGVVTRQIKAALEGDIKAPALLIKDSPVNRSLLLASGRRYGLILLIVMIALLSGWVFFDYWFKETYPARSREFRELDKVIASYHSDADAASTQRDFPSQPQPEQRAPQPVPKQDNSEGDRSDTQHSGTGSTELAGTEAANNEQDIAQAETAEVAEHKTQSGNVDEAVGTLIYCVQLQSFSSEQNARNYIRQFGQSRYALFIRQSGDYHIVFSQADSLEQAVQQENYYKNTHQLSVNVYEWDRTE